MKLSELLNSSKGKELTDELISSISLEVDRIKARAVNKVTTELEELKANHNELNSQLKEYTIKDEFVKLGGNPEKLKSFKKVLGDAELTEESVNEIFEEFPSLKAAPRETQEETIEDDSFGFTNNLTNINDSKSNVENDNSETNTMGLSGGTIV